jgi:hypothetical protein
LIRFASTKRPQEGHSQLALLLPPLLLLLLSPSLLIPPLLRLRLAPWLAKVRELSLEIVIEFPALLLVVPLSGVVNGKDRQSCSAPTCCS